jgi:hypothetical protein
MGIPRTSHSIGTAIAGFVDDQPPATPHTSFGRAVIAAAQGDGVDHELQVSGPRKPTLDDLAHPTLEQLKNVDIPALIEEAKQRIGNIDIRGLVLANVDKLPLPDGVKEAIKFLLDPKGYIERKFEELAKKADDAVPPVVKKIFGGIIAVGRKIEAFGSFVGGIGRGIKDGIEAAGGQVGRLAGAFGGAISNAGSAIGHGLANAGRAVLHLFGW